MYLQTMTLKNAIRLLAFKKNSRFSNYSKVFKLWGGACLRIFFRSYRRQSTKSGRRMKVKA